MSLVLQDMPAPGILRLAMHQPAKKNAMSRPMRLELDACFRLAQSDAAVHAVVLCGAGGTFSAGGDLDGIAAIAPEAFRAYLAEGHELVRLVHGFGKPLVAAIDGIGVGGGVALALCADAVVMGRSARVGLPFFRIGFVPDWGTLHTLPRRVGWQTARRLFAMSGLIGADDALRIGLCDEVADDAVLQDAAVLCAQRLAALPPQAFAETKRIMNALAGSLEDALRQELDAQQACFTGPEFAEGVAAFREKRQPSFRS